MTAGACAGRPADMGRAATPAPLKMPTCFAPGLPRPGYSSVRRFRSTAMRATYRRLVACFTTVFPGLSKAATSSAEMTSDPKFTCPDCGHETTYRPEDCAAVIRFEPGGRLLGSWFRTTPRWRAGPGGGFATAAGRAGSPPARPPRAALPFADQVREIRWGVGR